MTGFIIVERDRMTLADCAVFTGQLMLERSPRIHGIRAVPTCSAHIEDAFLFETAYHAYRWRDQMMPWWDDAHERFSACERFSVREADNYRPGVHVLDGYISRPSLMREPMETAEAAAFNQGVKEGERRRREMEVPP